MTSNITYYILTIIYTTQNAFLELDNSDPYKALSFDRLHAFHSGLFGHHLWTVFKELVSKISNNAIAAVDSKYGATSID